MDHQIGFDGAETRRQLTTGVYEAVEKVLANPCREQVVITHGFAPQSTARPNADEAVGEVLAMLRTADSTAVESSAVDTDAAAHRAAYLA